MVTRPAAPGPSPTAAAPATAVAPGTSLGAALRGHEGLAGLLQRVRQSQQRLAVIYPLLPAGLREGVRAGPLDDTAWALLVDNSAAAAKLRQLLPQLEQALRGAGWPGPAIKIRVRPAGAAPGR